MPRNGDGSSDNVVEAGENQVHGVGSGNVSPIHPSSHMSQQPSNIDLKDQASSGVDRSNKAAPAPETEKGEAIEGLNASGGGNKIQDSGKGESKVHKDNE